MRNARIVVISLSIAVILTQYQNCAGSGGANSSSATSVRQVDDLNDASILFPQPNLQLYQDDQSVNLGGICNDSHDGQSFSWSIEVSGSTLASGQGTCGQGQFQFDATGVQNWVCGVEYTAQVTAEWGDSTQMTITKRCAPLAMAAASWSGVGQPQTCELEYRLSGEGSDQGLCQTACFSTGILSSLEDEPLESCSGLISSLAGQ